MRPHHSTPKRHHRATCTEYDNKNTMCYKSAVCHLLLPIISSPDRKSLWRPTAGMALASLGVWSPTRPTVTYKSSGGSIQDVDIIRRPRLVKHCTAAACAAVAGHPEDAFGLAPADTVRPVARYFGSLFASDYHSVNRLLSKWVAQMMAKRQESRQPGEELHCHLASWCTQHKTGNVVESVTKFLGLLSPTFCLASTFAQGDVYDSSLRLRQLSGMVISKPPSRLLPGRAR